jgi:uncharacterized protein YbjT (DUF2867 family)
MAAGRAVTNEICRQNAFTFRDTSGIMKKPDDLILIVGGSGSLGRATAKLLLARGSRVRVMTRSPDEAGALIQEGAEIVRGDLLDAKSLASACRGADQVLAAAHSIFGRGRQSSIHVDDQGHRELIAAANSAGVRRFIYTSAYANGPSARRVPFFRIKAELEKAVIASGMRYTILRPTAFMEPHAHTLVGLPVAQKGKVMIFGDGTTPRNFVAPEDVARVAEIALTGDALEGESIDIGGPENLTTMNVIRLYERLSERTSRVTHLPLGLPRLLAPLAHPFHPGLGQILALAALSDEDQSFDAEPLARRLSLQWTGLEAWARARLKLTGRARDLSEK